MHDFAGVGAEGTPAPNEAHVVGARENGQTRRAQGRCDMLAGGIVADILVTICDNGADLADTGLQADNSPANAAARAAIN